ncbi:hypothetical protein [Sphingobacterium psychroaquaticum]|uniref:Four helix bundle sensory module for signal transduction n=2 Tax=Sphingobacterium psychroaquaticum TaxID=561061 RepID=A0A1X7J5E0_9SPHI|nr:hypothetical protein [Sphingobacterium psychroaquaticum]SMG22856.1 hypothetical protein SAMN05660862_1469 [Sphingobacterium psychroaquaticum]
MYKLLILFVTSCCLYLAGTGHAHANITADSISFEDQRARINELLDARSKRFGDFDESLLKKTGIFGIFKTTADMQRSIDILKEIVITDNNIFIETKKLIDIKDYQSERNAALAKEYDDQVTAYMKTVSKLQQENDKLRTEIESLDTSEQQSNMALYLAVGIILSLLFVIYQRFSKKRLKKVT